MNQILNLSDSQKSIVTAAPLDTQGNPGTITSTPAWNSSDTTIAVVGNVSGDGLTATVTAIKPGTCTVAAIANTSAGTVTTPFTVNVLGGPATSFFYTFGTPS